MQSTTYSLLFVLIALCAAASAQDCPSIANGAYTCRVFDGDSTALLYTYEEHFTNRDVDIDFEDCPSDLTGTYTLFLDDDAEPNTILRFQLDQTVEPCSFQDEFVDFVVEAFLNDCRGYTGSFVDDDDTVTCSPSIYQDGFFTSFFGRSDEDDGAYYDTTDAGDDDRAPDDDDDDYVYNPYTSNYFDTPGTYSVVEESSSSNAAAALIVAPVAGLVGVILALI